MSRLHDRLNRMVGEASDVAMHLQSELANADTNLQCIEIKRTAQAIALLFDDLAEAATKRSETL